MSDDFAVSPLSNREIREYAFNTKRTYGAERRWPVNIVKCLQSGFIPTRFGKKILIYKVVDDKELGTKDARTDFEDGKVVITVKRSVHDKANWGDGRSRMTLAHELAHGVLHYGVTMYRSAGASGTTALSQINAARSAEHQAKVFASAFLIDDEVAATFDSAQEVSTEFLVSLEAAEICWSRVMEKKSSKEYIRELNESFQADTQPVRHQFSYSEKACPECQNPTLIPIGVGLLCHTCGYHETAE
ncbi:MAG: ImmA/IrrE family metallo-endopeptidase [Rhizobiales bacterium]|nr:ImmA/IrrE family metallo-endopeptidase [Hyphomicrobiales bacterium]